MNIMFRKWRGLQVALAIVASALVAQAAVQVKTLGGGPNQTSNGRSGSANGDTLNNAKFNSPNAVAADSNGNLYVADRVNNKIRKITKAGAADSITSTFATRVPSPVGVAVDGSNNVYVVTQRDGKLRKYASNGTLLQTVSGLISPTALALGANGEAYVTEVGGNVKRVALDGTKTLVASGFNRPRGIAVLPSGRLVVSDTGNNAIFTAEANPTTNDIPPTLIAGGVGAGFNDGPGLSAQFNQPHGVAVAPNGQIVVADRKNHRVRLIDTSSSNNVVSTLFGVDRTLWAKSFAGWSDGDASTASVREPVGVTVDRNGTVFDTEVAWHLIRQATGGAVTATNGTGNATNVVVIGTNTVTVVGTNVVSFGFESGEASSDFVGAAGQHFYAPVTLNVAPGQKGYTFQMSLSVTGETGVALNPSEAGFVSMLVQPGLEPNTYFPIPQNFEFTNSVLNLLGVGWLTRYQMVDLYDTLKHDLLKYSIAKDTLFESVAGKVVLGAYRVPIPSAAPADATFRIALRNPSGTADGVSQPLPLQVPTNGSFGAGALNTLKRITLASRPYLVGDGASFRWYNAGDFGNGSLANDDVIELYQTAIYGKPTNSTYHGVNFLTAMTDSDLFNAMDSSDGLSVAAVEFGDDVSINSITSGDGKLEVDDVWVTFRRSLDPSLKWFARYWANGSRQVVEVPNTLEGGFGGPVPLAAASKSKVAAKAVSRPSALLTVGDSMASANAVLQLPVQLNLEGEFPARVMMLNVTVEALDGSPSLTAPIQFQTAPAFRNPELSDSRGPNNFSAAWLNNTISGMSGDSLLALLSVQVPANAGPGAAYRVYFNHFSVSPNGHALFDARTTSGLILLSDRSASTWSDGIADAWRLRYFGSIFAAESAPGADADGDGVINSAEYQNGTDPTDSLSN